MSQKQPQEIIEKIRTKVNNGKTKIQVANELKISYYQVKKYTKGIQTELRIPFELEQKIREMVKSGKSKRQVAEKLGLSRDTVIKYTRDILICRKTSKRSLELVKLIRENVHKYNSKSKTARVIGLSYDTVKWYTQDIKIKTGLSQEMKENIRKEVLSGKSKFQVAQDFNLSYQTVLKNTIDIQSKYTCSNNNNGGNPGIRGRTLDILKNLLIDGYYLCNPGDTTQYRTLRKYFHSIYKVNSCGKTIIFLEDKCDIAAKALLEVSNKKIMSYQELKQVTNIFNTNLTGMEKQRFLSKNRSKKTSKNHGSKSDSPLGNDGSLAFFYIRDYC